MTHTPFDQHTKELTALLKNPVLIYTKNFYSGRLSISTLIILHLLTNSLDIPLPTPPSRSFTLCDIPDRFRRRFPDSTPQSFPMFLIPDPFGDFPT